MTETCGQGWSGIRGHCIRERIKKPKNIARVGLAVAGIGAGLALRSKFKSLSPAQKNAAALGLGAALGAGGAALIGHKLQEKSEKSKKIRIKKKKVKRILERVEKLNEFTKKRTGIETSKKERMEKRKKESLEKMRAYFKS